MATKELKDVQIDPRGYRFGAAITLLLAITALVLGATNPGVIVMFVLAALFLPGAIIGPQATAQASIFKALIRPRLSPPKETESFRPPRFAQQMGLGFAVLAIVLGVWGPSWGFLVMAGFIVVASFLNAAFNFCLGCEIYLLAKRATKAAA